MRVKKLNIEGEEIKYLRVEQGEYLLRIQEGCAHWKLNIEGEEGVIKYSVIEGEGGWSRGYLLRIQEGCAHYIMIYA